jgi:type IX secretion system PorP/SprF family membrane protein
MKKPLIISVLCFLCSSIFAQDAHHSQYFNLPAYYNPAAAGHDVEHIRLTGLYRRQWPSLETPFITQSILFDKQVSHVGFGALLNKNSAGDGSIQRMQLGGMLSYRFSFHDHQFATGISIGFIQKRFDPGKMTFDDQYTDDNGYDPSNPTAEQFAFTKVVRPDFSAGILYSYGDITKTRCVPYVGASLMHINQPDEVLIEQTNSNPRKASLQAGMRFSCNEKVEIAPSMMLAMQQFSSEMMAGAKAVYKFDPRTKVEGGIYIRNKESVIAYAGYQWNSLMVGVSYDAGISNAVTGPAAFELSLTYIPKAKAKKERKHTEAAPATTKKPAPAKPETKSAENKKVNPAVKQESKSSVPPAKQSAVKETKTTSENNQQKQNIPSASKEKNTIPDAEVKKIKSPEKPEKEAAAPTAEKHKIAAPAPDKKEKTETVKPNAAAPVAIKVEKEKPKTETVKSNTAAPVAIKVEKEKPAPVKVNPAPEQKTAADTDHDGVPDVSDACPDVKGSAATNGCPDSDGDNIADADDKCPNEKGMINNNGCPVKPETNNLFDRVLLFNMHSAVVDRFDVIDILEPVSDILFFDQNAKLVIFGYAYEEGDEKANSELSMKRAEAVKQFFVNNGVAADKVETVAYGSSKPIAADTPEETSRKNRRVEIQIVHK